MLANIQDVENWLRENELLSWEIRGKDSDNSYIFQTKIDEVLEERFNRFRRVMTGCTGGRFIIYGHKSEKMANSGRFREEFSNLGVTQGGQSQITGVGNIVPEGYISRSEFEALWEKKMQDLEMIQLKNEIKDLKTENKDLKTPKEEFFRIIAPYAEPVIKGLSGKMFPQAAGLPTQIGTLDVEQNNNILMNSENQEFNLTEDEYSSFQIAITNWSTADPNWLACLEKVSQLAVTGDSMYNMAKGMLLK